MSLLFGWVLGILGAIGGVLWLSRVVDGTLRRLRTRRLHGRSPVDFAYETLEIGARVFEGGSRWEVTRTARVASLCDGLEHIDIGVRPLNKISATYEVKPNNLTLETLQDRVVGYDRFVIKPNEPLNRNQTLQFTFQCNFVKERQRDDFLTWGSNRRVDRLVLRVLFPNGDLRAVVKGQIVSQAGHVVEEHELHPDPVTREYRLEANHLAPTAVYSISWKVEE